jgi:hypothetical protein
MNIKNTPFSAAIATALLSWNVTVQANDEVNNNTSNQQSSGNNNAVHNWMPQQSNNDFWQTPDWNGFQPPAAATQAPQAVATDSAPQTFALPAPASQAPTFSAPTIQAPALQVPVNQAPANNGQFVPTSEATSEATPETASKAPSESAIKSGENSEAMPGNSAAQAAASQNQAQNGMPAMNVPPQMPGFNNNYRPPMPQVPNYRPPYQNNPYQRPFATPMYPPMQNGYRPYPPANMNQGYRPPQNAYRPNPSAPQGGQFTPPAMPGNAPPAYNMPRYNNNGYNNRYNNNNWGGNNFWGRSGPSTWTNPNKQNMEQGWDDMINAPSRMGTMPGGWNAPEISMPNPIDMGDQFQDNIQDLPEQIRNMDVGN